MPERIQRKRTKGWKAPEGAVYVGRPTFYGNPFTPELYWHAGYSGTHSNAIQHCVDAYRAWITGSGHWFVDRCPPTLKRPDISELRGKDLMCWCPVGSPCHADVLLEISNA